MKKILVVGSLNMDSVVETPHMPKAGETIAGKHISLVPGGKGANQAYAAGKLGGQVGIIGAIGNDSFGLELKANLEQVNVDTSGLSVLKDTATGQAFITVDDRGENTIIIIAGANGQVSRELINRNFPLLEESDIIIMQLEIPLEVVEYVKDIAVKLGKQVILDPAPAVPGLQDHFWQGIDYIKPNETELAILTGRELKNQEDLRNGAREMLAKGVKGVIVTMGQKGCLFVTETKETYFPANKVQAVDATAAGDCFTAGFALALSRGKSCEEAILFGQKASAIAVTRKGAQTSIPTIEEVEMAEGGGMK